MAPRKEGRRIGSASILIRVRQGRRTFHLDLDCSPAILNPATIEHSRAIELVQEFPEQRTFGFARDATHPVLRLTPASLDTRMAEQSLIFRRVQQGEQHFGFFK